MGNSCCNKRKRRHIVLLLIGLDNAGKTKAANTLAGDPVNSPVPTVGFSVVNLKYLSYNVKVFDLGGGPNIRGIWNQYFVDAHGIIFVIDSSDFSRFEEAKAVLEDVLHDNKIAGKPVLILANKQDQENALDEVDIIECLKIEQLVNFCKCLTLVQSCSVSEKNSTKLDPGIHKGYEWLMNIIIKDYEILNKRVENDVIKQEEKEREELLARIGRIKTLEQTELSKKEEDAIESYSDYARKLNVDTEVNEIPLGITVLDYDDKHYLNNDDDDSSKDSSISFPPVYYINVENSALSDRPKSAIQIVKHQLQLNNNIKRTSLKLRSNKTVPMNLYGVKLPHSAGERGRDFTNQRRNLRSADDCLFTISNKVPMNYVRHTKCTGNHNYGDSIQMNNLDTVKKLPLLTVKNNVPWGHKTVNNGDNVTSVVDIV